MVGLCCLLPTAYCLLAPEEQNDQVPELWNRKPRRQDRLPELRPPAARGPVRDGGTRNRSPTDVAGPPRRTPYHLRDGGRHRRRAGPRVSRPLIVPADDDRASLEQQLRSLPSVA